MKSNRYENGLKKYLAFDRKKGKKMLEYLKSVSPDLEKYVIEFMFGDILSRPVLDIKPRLLIAIGLLAQQNATAQLKGHVYAALKLGCTQQEIREVVIQTLIYAGFPTAINAMKVVNEAFNKVKEQKKVKDYSSKQ